MDTSVMFLDCPAYMDSSGAARCGLPAAVEYRYTIRSSDGPLESAKIRCPRDHCFNGPLDALIWDEAPRTRRASAIRRPNHAAPAAPGRGSAKPGQAD